MIAAAHAAHMQALCARSVARARKGGAAEVARRARVGPTQRKPEVDGHTHKHTRAHRHHSPQPAHRMLRDI